MLNTRVTSSGALAALLARRPPQRVNWGLARMNEMLEALGHPEAGLRAIHVAGTNGKGSVVVTADSILRAAGHRTGRYTSPHLVGFSERIAVDGQAVSDELLESCAQGILPLAERVDATFFEAATALAFDAFRRSGVTTAVVEVGLGGRLDATNVLDAAVSVITSIDLDHAEYLGTDLVSIAREKAGIIGAGRTAVIGPVAGAAGEELRSLAGELGAHVVQFGTDVSVEAVEVGREGTQFTYRGGARRRDLRLVTPLHGAHQAVNAALAVAAVDALAPGGVDDGQVCDGVESVHWPGRFQIDVRHDGTWVYDIAHNPAGARALADVVAQVDLPEPVVLLVSVLADKAWSEVLAPLLAVTDAAVLTLAPSVPAERRWNATAARESLGESKPAEVVLDFDRALSTARVRAGNGTVLVAGSCHTVGDALRRNACA